MDRNSFLQAVCDVIYMIPPSRVQRFLFGLVHHVCGMWYIHENTSSVDHEIVHRGCVSVSLKIRYLGWGRDLFQSEGRQKKSAHPYSMRYAVYSNLAWEPGHKRQPITGIGRI